MSTGAYITIFPLCPEACDIDVALEQGVPFMCQRCLESHDSMTVCNDVFGDYSLTEFWEDGDNTPPPLATVCDDAPTTYDDIGALVKSRSHHNMNALLICNEVFWDHA